MPVTIEQIIPICYPPVLDIMLSGYSFINRKLRCKHKHNQIRLRDLGAYVEVPREDGTSKRYGVTQICVPINWAAEDNLRNPTENQRVNLVKQLLENGLHSLDDVFLNQLKRNMTAIVSKHFKYRMSHVQEVGNGQFVVKLYTLVAFVDKLS